MIYRRLRRADRFKFSPSSEMCEVNRKRLTSRSRKGGFAPVGSPTEVGDAPTMAAAGICPRVRRFFKEPAMARHKKISDARLSRLIAFRLSEDQFAALLSDAASGEIGPNELSRRLTLKREGRVVLKVSRRADPAVIAQLKRTGNLLNQLVHNAHIFGRVSPQVPALCEEIGDIILRAVEEGEEE